MKRILTPVNKAYSQICNVTGSNSEITFVLEKHVVEDNVLFTNHLAAK